MIRQRYQSLLASGTIEPDAAQARLVARLATLSAQLAEHRLARKTLALGWLFARRVETKDAPRGLYIHGAVGRGKTMLMDLFFSEAEVKRKRRAHFHAFMADVHERIFAFRQKVKAGQVKDTDPIAVVAEALADEAWLLCFDEFSVTDIADAMILGRLFQALFARGVVVVATSNVAPADLYQDGLNRALFLPFITLIGERMPVFELDARTDFRLEKLADAAVWHVPADKAARAALDRTFSRLIGGETPHAVALEVKGRRIEVPACALGVARFSFATLCEAPLGAADFLAIARDFHTLVLDGVPVMDDRDRNAAKRFITLIDIVYENKVKLVASAAAEPSGLYRGQRGAEVLEFRRTASRLIEMRSRDYLALPHGRADSRASGDSTGLVET